MGEIRFDADLLIIGGGSAGCMAAIKAKDADPKLRVVVVEKASLRRGGAIGRGMDAYNIGVIPGIATPEQLVQTLTGMEDNMVDQRLVYQVGTDGFGIMQDLESWGVEFPRDENGQYIVPAFHPTGRFMVEMRGEAKVILARETLRRGADVLERVVATSLLTDNGKVVGFTGLNIRTGDFVVGRAPAVVITTGAAGRFGIPETGYLKGTFECPSCAGDGYSLALQAGAELANMEQTTMGPMFKDYNGPGWSTFVRHGAHFLNGLGERFMVQYDPVLVERMGLRKITWAIWKEYNEGRGPVYLSMTHLPEESIRIVEEGLFTTERPTFKQFWEAKGIDLRRSPVQVVLDGPFLCGGHGIAGIVINERAESSLPGLYAAGDVVASVRGSLPGALVFGAIAGRHGAEYARGVDEPRYCEDQVRQERERVFGALKRESGISPWGLEFKLRRMVRELIGPPKVEARLQEAIVRLEGFKSDLRELVATDPHELMAALECQAIVDCAEMCARASLARKESRWGIAHYRVDYPKRDDVNWQKRILVRRDPETAAVSLATRPVTLDPRFP